MKKLSIMALFITCVLIISGCGILTYTGDFCEDEIIDRDETDIDCGGQYCDPCEIGKICEENNDCESGNCVSEICAEAAADGTTDDSAADDQSSIADADSDGVADAEDVCEGFDDAMDTDADTVPDGCDKADIVITNLVHGGTTSSTTPSKISLLFSLTIENTGTEDVEDVSELVYKIVAYDTSGTDVGSTSDTVTELVAGESKEVSTSLDVDETVFGTGTVVELEFKVEVDTEHAVDESDETDNSQSFKIIVNKMGFD